MPNPPLADMFSRLLRPTEQTRAAKTVEAFGWLILAEGIVLMLAPHFVAALLHLPALEPQGTNYLRLAALLVCGVGMLYVVSGRNEACVRSLLDRVGALVMAVL
jgi:uncharacterized protein YjeT (DUF2065 family)